MSTNLLFGTNQNYVDGTHTASSTDAAYAVDNFAGNDLGHRWKAGSTGTSHWLKYQVQPGQAAVNYFAISAAAWTILDTTTPNFTLATSPDNSTWTTWRATGNLTSADLMGPNNEDYLYYNATAADAAGIYARLTIGYGSTGFPELKKFYCGPALDLGRDPVIFDLKRTRSGIGARKPRYSIDLVYNDVSHTDTLAAIEAMGKVRQTQPIVLFTTTNHGVLNNMECVWCQLVALDTPQEITNRNNISMSFLELL